jgi:hypothetical protein
LARLAAITARNGIARAAPRRTNHFAFFFESLDEVDSFEDDSFVDDDSFAGVPLVSEVFESDDFASELPSDLESDLDSDFSPEGGWPVLPP